ncbi:hypothetical protein [Pontibacter beigongshangensis]|uniref:hypothetical protein n=1 Tax=Pontibacter beigongshangensis TaxID=2574733 RepID=UPI001650AB4B|nr:hypothetical protein [Pontibacter beigongshangensis]
MQIRFQSVLLLSLCSVWLGNCYRLSSSSGGGQGATRTSTRTVQPADIALPTDNTIEAIATGLTFPCSVAIDEQGQVQVLEVGYGYGKVWLPLRWSK